MKATPPAGPPQRVEGRLVRSVLRRPDLWWAALGALRRLAAPGWWRARPFLPRPDGRLWSFRMTTAYGRAEAEPRAADVVSYLEWCRATTDRHGDGRYPADGYRRHRVPPPYRRDPTGAG